MNAKTSKILAVYPPICADFYTKYTPFIRQIVRQNITTESDILSDIYLLYAENQLEFGELAKRLGVRKINGAWCQVDPIGHAASLSELELQGFDAADEREESEEQAGTELPDNVITTTRELSNKLHVSMRRAQQIFAAQIKDLAAGNDLFGMGV
jgi:hypothetical protein